MPMRLRTSSTIAVAVFLAKNRCPPNKPKKNQRRYATPVLFFLASYNIMLCVASSIFLSEKENIIFEILVISVATAQFKSNRLYNYVCFYASYPTFSLFLTRRRLRSEGSPTMPSIFKGFESGSCCLFIGWLAVSFFKSQNSITAFFVILFLFTIV